MAASHALLALLESAPAHGYTLKQRYDERFARDKPLAFGQVYASLNRFEHKGWAEVGDAEPGDGPDRRRYRITPEGADVVEKWVFAPQDPAVFATSTLFSRASVALMSGRSAERVLTEQRTVHLARMRDLNDRRTRADLAESLAISYELLHLDADLRWIEDAGRRLTDATHTHGEKNHA